MPPNCLSCPNRCGHSQGNQDILSGVDGLVVRAISIHMGSAVHQPGGIEHNSVPEKGGKKKAVLKRFTP